MPSPEAPRPMLLATPAGRWAIWFGCLGLLIAAAASLGGPLDPLAGLLIVAETGVRTGWPALLVLVSAVGIGRGIAHRVGPTPPWIRLNAGLALILLLLHLWGSMGVLDSAFSTILTIACLTGLFVPQRSTKPRLRPPPGWLWIGLPGVAVLLTAAASPPGTLWTSEYGAYDVLSYHLQLPQEWLLAGNTRPVEHNVYSFLPGGMEMLFAHVGALTFAPTGAEPGSAAPQALLAGDGWRLPATQYLHAGITIAAAGTVAALTRRLSVRAGLDRAPRRAASALAGGLVLCTPWTIVVGSLAYNEMGVVLLGAAAMLAAVRARRAPVSRGTLAAALVGIACLIKPTAIVFVAPVVGLLLLLTVPRTRRVPTLAAGVVAGLLALSPWLVRNAVVTGNPVFPLATPTLGTGHWTDGQADRFAEAHRFDGSPAARLRLLVWTDPASEHGDNPVARFRGAANPQWLLAFPLGLAGAGLLAAGTRSRAISLVLGAGLVAQLLGWLTLTHLQSRFLLPCLLTLAPLAGLGLARLGGPGRATAAWVFGGPALGVQAFGLWMLWSAQLGGTPAAMIAPGPRAMMGEPYTPEAGRVSPVAFINRELPPDARVLLVGGATPLYYRCETVYATVWDHPPVLALLGGEPGDPGSPTVGPGDFVLIDGPELARQRSSGYLDERITPGAIGRLVERLSPVRAWPELGQSLYRVPSGFRTIGSDGRVEP